jgi:hypothetical protein
MKSPLLTTILQEALRASTFESASFYPFDKTGKNDEVKRATRLYRETWLIPYLKEAIAVTQGDTTAKQAARKLGLR